MSSDSQRRRLHLILIGPPGAGKSTAAEELTKQFPLTVISTGNNLRAEVEKDSALGKKVAPLLEEGQFVPDELMEQLIRSWLEEVSPDQGVLLDGYPRTLHQAQALQPMLRDIDRPLDVVIAFMVDEDELVERLGGRRSCECGDDTFTLHISDAEAVQRCEDCNGELVQRDDDQPEVISERLQTYTEETQSLLDYYDEAGLLRTVDATGDTEAVFARVLEHLS